MQRVALPVAPVSQPFAFTELLSLFQPRRVWKGRTRNREERRVEA
jgi:hypothetical protein